MDCGPQDEVPVLWIVGVRLSSSVVVMLSESCGSLTTSNSSNNISAAIFHTLTCDERQQYKQKENCFEVKGIDDNYSRPVSGILGMQESLLKCIHSVID